MTGSGKVPEQVPNHGFREGSGKVPGQVPNDRFREGSGSVFRTTGSAFATCGVCPCHNGNGHE